MFNKPHAPFVPKEDANEPFKQKYNFADRFDVPVFTAKTEVFEFTIYSKKKVNMCTKKPTMKDITREFSTVCPKLIKKHNLSQHTKPHDYADIFIPFKRIRNSNHFSIGLINEWTNIKAHCTDSGRDSSTYKDWKEFFAQEIQTHLGIYLLQGLLPPPRVEMKFQPQAKDRVNGNNFVFHSTGTNGNQECRHKNFKAFLLL